MNEQLTKLIEEAIRGDAKAFEEVMRVKARHIYYIALKLMKDALDAEDAAQEAMLKMYSHIGDLKQPGAFTSWMYQTVARTCLNMQKKMTRDDHDYLESEDELNEMRREFLPQDYIEDVDKREFLMEIIDDLPERYRISLLLFYYEGMSYQEIARTMDTTEKIVDNVLQRARRRIKKQLDQKYEGQLTYASFQGVAALPVLGQVFQMDMAAKATPEILERLITGVEGVLAAGTAGVAASTATGAGGGTGATTTAASTAGASSLSMSAKMMIGLVATATAAGGTMLAFPGNGVAASVADSPPAQEEQIILTLADMIGEEAANRLQGYADGQGDWFSWPEFRDQLAVASLYNADEGTERYTLYQLEKQNKQLLIIEKQSAMAVEPDGGNGGQPQIQIVFHFTDRQEAAPQRMELFDSWARWQS